MNTRISHGRDTAKEGGKDREVELDADRYQDENKSSKNLIIKGY